MKALAPLIFAAYCSLHSEVSVQGCQHPSFATAVRSIAVPALLWLLSSQAVAATHRADYTPRVVSVSVTNPVFHGVPNLMMYRLTATVDDTYDNARHEAVVGVTTTPPPPGYPRACPTNATYTWSRQVHRYAAPQATKSWTLYNFQPGTHYYYAIRTGTAGNYEYRCGALTTRAAPTPRLPRALEELALVVDNSSEDYFSKYVLFDTDDCDTHNHLVALDADTKKIVWYLDIPAVTGIENAKVGGWRYQPRGSGHLTSDRIVATLNVDAHRLHLFELELDGTVINSKNFNRFASGGDGHLCDGSGPESIGPCPSHDAFRSDVTGDTYVLVTGSSGVGVAGNPTWNRDVCTDPPYQFLRDGIQALDGDYKVSFTQYLMGDLGYDPFVDPGPNAPAMCAASFPWIQTLNPWFNWIDWLHVNTVSGTADGQYLDISMKQMDQVARVRADGRGTEPVWTLAGDGAYSSFGPLHNSVVGAATFASQHDVHAVGSDTILLFDNKGNPGAAPGTAASRVLSISIDEGASPSARIEKSWALVDDNPVVISPLECPFKGSAQHVPGDTSGDSVLALCHNEWVIEELNDPTGAETRPSLYISIPAAPYEPCPVTGTLRPGIDGWYRAYPLDRIGDF
jgi:hypothetical protein